MDMNVSVTCMFVTVRLCQHLQRSNYSRNTETGAEALFPYVAQKEQNPPAPLTLLQPFCDVLQGADASVILLTSVLRSNNVAGPGVRERVM